MEGKFATKGSQGESGNVFHLSIQTSFPHYSGSVRTCSIGNPVPTCQLFLVFWTDQTSTVQMTWKNVYLMHLRFSHDSCFPEKCVRCPLSSSPVLLLTGGSHASPLSQVAVGCTYPFSFAKTHHVDQYCFIKGIDSETSSTNRRFGHLHLQLALKF